MNRATLTILLAILLAGDAFGAATYYVSTTGNDGNTGTTTGSPWTLKKGITFLAPDVTVVLLPGTWSGEQFKIYYYNGTAGHPAILRSQTKWQAVIANSTNRGVELYGASYIVLDGLCVSNSVNTGIKLMGDHNTVRNCWVVQNGTNTGQNGIEQNYVEGAVTDTNSVSEYNLIEWNGAHFGANAGHGHGIYASGPDQIIRGNVVRNNGGYGIQFYSGFDTTWQNNCQIYNNVTYGHTNHYGVVVYGANDPTANGVGTNYVFSNTILDGIVSSLGTVCLTNNIILPSVNSPTTPSRGFVPNATVYADYNFGTNAISPAGTHDVISAVLPSALFVSPTRGLYWLLSASVARGGALRTLFGPVDFFSAAPVAIAGIGAYQYNPAFTNDARTLDPSGPNPDYWATSSATATTTTATTTVVSP